MRVVFSLCIALIAATRGEAPTPTSSVATEEEVNSNSGYLDYLWPSSSPSPPTSTSTAPADTLRRDRPKKKKTPYLLMTFLAFVPLLYFSPSLRKSAVTWSGTLAILFWYIFRMTFSRSQETQEKRTRVRER